MKLLRKIEELKNSNNIVKLKDASNGKIKIEIVQCDYELDLRFLDGVVEKLNYSVKKA